MEIECEKWNAQEAMDQKDIQIIVLGLLIIVIYIGSRTIVYL